MATSASLGSGRAVLDVGTGLAGAGAGAGVDVATGGRSAARGGESARRAGSGVGLTAGFAESDSRPLPGFGVSRDSAGGATGSWGAAWSGGGGAAGGLSVLHPIAKLSIRDSKGNRIRFFIGMTPL